MKILVTGASGYVGAKIYQYLEQEYDVVGTYSKHQLFPELEQLELTDDQAVKIFIEEIHPDVIIHAAAIPSNGLFKEDPEAGQRINVDGTKSIVEAAQSVNSRLIFISSFAAFNPSNGYGQSKVDGEELVSTLTDYLILRLSLVIGLSPNTTTSNTFNKILKNITDKQSEPYDISWEMEVTYLGHVCKVIRTLIEHPEIKNLMIPIVSQGKTSKYQIAQYILSNFGLEAIQEDKQASIPLQEVDLATYQALGLPFSTYQDAIAEIVAEIKDLNF